MGFDCVLLVAFERPGAACLSAAGERFVVVFWLMTFEGHGVACLFAVCEGSGAAFRRCLPHACR